MLVGASVRAYHGPVRAYGAALAGAGDRCTIRPGGRRNGLLGPKAGLPWGYRHPGAWVLPQTGGAIASYRRMAGDSTLTAAPVATLPLSASMVGDSEMSATLGLVVSVIAALTGDATMTVGASGILRLSAALSGDSTMAAIVTARGFLSAPLAGDSALSGTVIGIGHLGAVITVADTGDALTAGAVAAAVWDSPEGTFLVALSRNKVITDPTAGTYTVYADDGTTPLYVADLWQDAAGTTPYAGAGADRRDRLT